MIITKQHKLSIVDNKIRNLEGQKYDIELQIKISKILKDRTDEMIEQLENNVTKHQEAIALLLIEREEVEQEEDPNGNIQ